MSRYAACGHVVASRRSLTRGPVDDALEMLGLRRDVIVVVSSFPAVLAISVMSDLVGLVTDTFARAEEARTAGANGVPVYHFALPVRTSAITVSQMWHPRANSDLAHCWLRQIVLSTCRSYLTTFDKPRAFVI